MAIEILGVNERGHESGNASMCEGRDLAWLQETDEHPVWTDWEVGYRDVIVLDADNKPLDVYNLTEHDLDDPGNYAELKDLLSELAK